jgi:hypothetical protein
MNRSIETPSSDWRFSTALLPLTSSGSTAPKVLVALSWKDVANRGVRAHSAQLHEGSFFGTRCLGTGGLGARLCQWELVRSRHPGKYPKLESSTLSHPAFEPLTEHHATKTGCSAGATSLEVMRHTTNTLGWGRCCQCAQQHNKSGRTPSFGRIRFYRLFEKNSKSHK